MRDLTNGIYNYPEIYSVYDYTIINGNKIDKNIKPIARIRASTPKWRYHKVVYNGVLTNSKILSATIETPDKATLKPNMYLKNSSGLYFKIQEVNFIPDLDRQMYGKSRSGLTQITIIADDN